ncbi:MAG: pyridoxal 5'-phosphate synthase glutaminase subunit PdxT [Candidatus Bipolaricaulota bacterium]|nr:pyridoxal 5'-phosphate synthase glutaminase subunit PdxT [Candidatus Bipolaricaulota bacterium]
MRIGVLGMQGAVREHLRSLAQLGIDGKIVKKQEDLSGLSGLILPGGESTAISLLAAGSFLEELRSLARDGFPFFGTCAGMILLAHEIQGREDPIIDAIDITVARNASGRQVDSFETILAVEGIGGDVPAVFIRAPYVTRLGEGVTSLAQHEGSVVMAQQGNVLVSSFHPELTDDPRVHRYFLRIVKAYMKE